MKSLLSDQRKFEKITLKNGFYNFRVTHYDVANRVTNSNIYIF